MKYVDRALLFEDDGIVTDDYGNELSPLDDDYYAHKSELKRMCDPLDDDYGRKYDVDYLD